MALSPFVAALLGGVLLIQAGVVQAARTVTDLADRQVSIPESVNRVILGESRYIPALAILDGDATIDRLAGILPDFEQTDPGGYAQYLERFPALAEVPMVGHASADSFSLESVLAIGADLAIFSLEGHGPGAHNRALIERLERAGVVCRFPTAAPGQYTPKYGPAGRCAWPRAGGAEVQPFLPGGACTGQ